MTPRESLLYVDTGARLRQCACIHGRPCDQHAPLRRVTLPRRTGVLAPSVRREFGDVR